MTLDDAGKTSRQHFNASVFICIALILSATFVTMHRVMRYEFTNWDDPHTIVQNPVLLPPTFDSLLHIWKKPYADLYVPATYTMWWLIAHQSVARVGVDDFALDAPPFHIANLVIHALAAIFLFELLRRLIRNHWAACAGAMLFALHPVQVESVAWISGGKDVLSGLLSIIAILQYVDYALLPSGASARRTVHWIAAMIAFVLAVLAKPSAVVLPAIFIAIDAIVLRRSVKQIVRGALPMVALAVPFVALTCIVQPARFNTNSVALYWRPLTALDALAFYLGKLVWPTHQVVDYGRFPKHVISSGAIFFTWIAPAIAGAIAWMLRRRWPTLAAGAVIFVLALMPVLGWVEFDFQELSLVADHYLYLPMIGIALAVAGGLARINRAAIYIVAAIPIALFGWRAHDQTRYWSDGLTLFEHQVLVNPNSWIGQNNLVEPLMRHHRIDEAEAAARKSLDLRDDNEPAHANLGLILLRRGDQDEAMRELKTAIQLHEGGGQGLAVTARLHFAKALEQTGDVDGAIAEYQKILSSVPDDPTARRRLPPLLERRAATTKPTTSAS